MSKYSIKIRILNNIKCFKNIFCQMRDIWGMMLIILFLSLFTGIRYPIIIFISLLALNYVFSNFGKRRTKYLILWNRWFNPKKVFVGMTCRKWVNPRPGMYHIKGKMEQDFFNECMYLLEVLPSGTKVVTCSHAMIMHKLKERGIKYTHKAVYKSILKKEMDILGNMPSGNYKQMYNIEFIVP